METIAPAPVAPAPNHPKFVRWAIVLGIVIVLNVFFAVLISLVLPSPKYDAFCPSSQVMPSYDTQEACTAVGGQWNENQTLKYPTDVPQPAGYCDPQYTCRMQFDDASQSHARDAFIAFVVLGVIALAAGVLPIGSSIVSSGLSYGGVITLIIGSAQYWGSADEWIRLIIAAVALVALLYIGWKRFRD